MPPEFLKEYVLEEETYACIRSETAKKMQRFEKIRGEKDCSNFWDIVVLSAMDHKQKLSFEVQLEEKCQRNELPLSCKYHVINDPPGLKIGNGGGVLTVVDELEKIYKGCLLTKKVIIVLSGGYSQRLPSASALGKIFTSLPIGNPVYQMLEAKLAMFIDLPERMQPGIFVASSDCFELFHLKGNAWNFNQPGITALGHLSSIEIGTSHGVFITKDKIQNCECGEYCTQVVECRRFLHKPSKDSMRKQGAVMMRGTAEMIYSDSAYFMNMDTTMLLLKWFRSNGPLACEIDAYGDFLQSLGEDATDGYCDNSINVTFVDEALVKTRKEIFHLLKGTPLNVVLLERSRFYHIGTTQEYLHYLCVDPVFKSEMCCLDHVMLKTDSPFVDQFKNVFICSYIEDMKCVNREKVMVEYSSINKSNRIGENVVVSHCDFPENLLVPSNTFIHTVPINDGSLTRYVSIVFGINDDLKKTCKDRYAMELLSYFEIPFREVARNLGLPQDPWPENSKALNLWNARIFSAHSSAQESVRASVSYANNCRTRDFASLPQDAKLYSMNDVMLLKDLHVMLEFREQIKLKVQT